MYVYVVCMYMQAAIDAVDNKGATALHLAAKKSGREMCRKLLAAGATPDLTDADGETALEAAARSGRDFTEKYLRFYGRLPRPLARYICIHIMCMCICTYVHMLICSSICASTAGSRGRSPGVWWHAACIHLSIYLLSIHISIHLSIHLSIYLSIYPSIYLSVYLYISLYLYISIYTGLW